jgi:DNA-binding NarL/FixJ family response regulator
MLRVLVVAEGGYLADGIRRHLDLVRRQSEWLEEITVETVLTGADAVRFGRSAPPALVFVDLSLPDEESFTLIRRLRREIPSSKVMACSMYLHGSLVARTLAAGGHGYIVKSIGHDEFGRVVRVVLEGGLGVPDAVRAQWMRDLLCESVLFDTVRGGQLSSVDVRVVFGIVHGVTTAELASQWGCAESDVVKRQCALQARVGYLTAEQWCWLAMAAGLMPYSWDELYGAGSA